MNKSTSISLYGDSILRATIPDAQLRYHFHYSEYEPCFAGLPAQPVNRARFGATSEKGLQLLLSDIRRGTAPRLALLEYGGNDSNYDWAAIAAAPQQCHLPAVPLEEFCRHLTEMVRLLRQAGSQPVLMTLPPIHGQRYFEYFSRGLNQQDLLTWLHGDIQIIYRRQEMYSCAVAQLAAQQQLPCIDVRTQFLQQDSLDQLISADGIHLSAAGYTLLFDALRQGLARLISQPVAV